MSIGTTNGSRVAGPNPRADYFLLMDECPYLFANCDGSAFQILVDPADINEAEREMGKRLNERNLPSIWATVGVVFRDQYITVLRDAVRFVDGSLGTYIRRVPSAGDAPGVVILPVYETKVVLANHFRHATRSWHLEVPRGFGTPGSTPEADALRELKEEISGRCRTLISMGTAYPDTGIDATSVEVFFADLDALGAVDTDEGIERLLMVTVEKLELMMASGEIDDGYTLSAFALAKARKLL